VNDYVFKLKKGELELELKSDDPRFIEIQMDHWRNALLQAAAVSSPTTASTTN
jgi:hypothetical protein